MFSHAQRRQLAMQGKTRRPRFVTTVNLLGLSHQLGHPFQMGFRLELAWVLWAAGLPPAGNSRRNAHARPAPGLITTVTFGLTCNPR